jgi:hypothetical protein
MLFRRYSYLNPVFRPFMLLIMCFNKYIGPPFIRQLHVCFAKQWNPGKPMKERKKGEDRGPSCAFKANDLFPLLKNCQVQVFRTSGKSVLLPAL